MAFHEKYSDKKGQQPAGKPMNQGQGKGAQREHAAAGTDGNQRSFGQGSGRPAFGGGQPRRDDAGRPSGGFPRTQGADQRGSGQSSARPAFGGGQPRRDEAGRPSGGFPRAQGADQRSSGQSSARAAFGGGQPRRDNAGRPSSGFAGGAQRDDASRGKSDRPGFGREQRRDDVPQRGAGSQYREGRPNMQGNNSPRGPRRGFSAGPDRYESRTQQGAEGTGFQQARFGPNAHFARPAPVAAPLQGALAFDNDAAGVQPVYELPENLLSGRNPIREALKAGRDIEKLLVASGELSGSAREIVAMAKNAGIIVQVVERSRLDQITRNHQGMIAFASAFAYSDMQQILDSAKEKGEAPFLIILDKVTDPQNLGAIIRTAACVGAHGVVVQLHRAVGLTPSAVRASAGGVEYVKVARVVNINHTIRDLKKQGIWVYAADAQGKDFATVKFDGAAALVIGSEGEGVSQHTLELCDERIAIPMSGAIDSLNASVAAGILMYAVYVQRIAKP